MSEFSVGASSLDSRELRDWIRTGRLDLFDYRWATKRIYELERGVETPGEYIDV